MSSRFAFALALALVVVPGIHLRSAAAEQPVDNGDTIKATNFEDFLAGKYDHVAAKPATADEALPLSSELSDEDVRLAAIPESPRSKPTVYTLVVGGERGDFAIAMDCPMDATVGDVLRNAIFPHPLDFASSEIYVSRIQHPVKDDLTVVTEEENLLVQWDPATNQPSEKTNLHLQPNDRICIRLPNAAAAPCSPVCETMCDCYTLTSSVASPSILADSPQPLLLQPPHAAFFSAEPSPHAAVPACVPSPFAVDSDVFAAQAFECELQSPTAESRPEKPSQVVFDIVVMEDLDDSFAEFEQLNSQMPFMLTDTATIQGTLRILKKHDLVHCLSSPKLVVTTGQKAMIEVGTETPGAEQPWQGLKAEMGARALGGGLAVDFSFNQTQGRQTDQVQTSLIVPHGQTVVMKAGSQILPASDDEDAEESKVEHAVYVVLTPEIVK